MSKITVIRSTKTVAPKGYTIVELAYKTDEGKTKGMKIFGFGKQKENSEVAGNAKAGDVLEVQFQQNEKGFWEFATIKATGEVQSVGSGNAGVSASGATPSTTSAARSNWETSDERAARQVLIVRQSSLSNAIAFFEVAKVKPSTKDVVSVAAEFEEYVLKGSEYMNKKYNSVKQTGDVE